MLARCLALAAALLFAPALSLADDNAETKIALQASMQRHIERNLVDGAFMIVDYANGQLRKVFPAKAHSMILVGDGFYVMCADVRDEDGKTVPVDYYLIETQRGFRVVRTEIANRAPLQAMMQDGKVRRF